MDDRQQNALNLAVVTLLGALAEVCPDKDALLAAYTKRVTALLDGLRQQGKEESFINEVKVLMDQVLSDLLYPGGHSGA